MSSFDCSAYDGDKTQFWVLNNSPSTDPSALTQGFSLIMTTLILFSFAGMMILHVGQSGSTSIVSSLFQTGVAFGTVLAGWWIFGYAFAYGTNYITDESRNSPTKSYEWFIGDGGYFLQNINPCEYFIFAQQFAYAAFAAVIFLGGISDRGNKLTCVVFSTLWFVCWVYPTTVHWTNSRTPWLGQGDIETINAGVGYYDNAGAGWIHCAGGIAALVGAKVIGARASKPAAHSIPLVSLGTAFALLGVVSINVASVVSVHQYFGVGSLDNTDDGVHTLLILINTFLSVAGAASAVLILQVARKDEFWSFTQLCNGMIAGAVSVAAGCNTIYPWAAFVIGMIGGVVYVMWSGVVSKAGIDDASDSFAIHFGCGAWSLIAVTLFAMDKQKELGQYYYIMDRNSGAGARMGGIFYDSGDRVSWVRLGWNLFGMLMIAAWVATNMFFIFFILKTVGQLRNDDSTIGGRGGEDKMNHGVDAYVVSASPAVPAKAATGDSVEEGEGAGSVEVKTSQI